MAIAGGKFEICGFYILSGDAADGHSDALVPATTSIWSPKGGIGVSCLWAGTPHEGAGADAEFNAVLADVSHSDIRNRGKPVTITLKAGSKFCRRGASGWQTPASWADAIISIASGEFGATAGRSGTPLIINTSKIMRVESRISLIDADVVIRCATKSASLSLEGRLPATTANVKKSRRAAAVIGGASAGFVGSWGSCNPAPGDFVRKRNG